MNNVFHLHLREMCEYLRWGDQQCLIAARSVSDEEYFKDYQISSGSLHKTLVHCMTAQWLWLCRFRGESPPRTEDETDYPTRMSVEQRWPLVHAALIDFVGRLTPNQLTNPITYHDTKGAAHTLPLRDMILYLVDHASYHRGQIATLIKRGGGKAVPVTYKHWINEKNRIAR